MMNSPAENLKKRLGIKCVQDKINEGRTVKNLSNVKGGYIYARGNQKWTASALIPCFGCYLRKSGSFYSLEEAHMFINEMMSLPIMEDAIMEKFIVMSRAEMTHQLKLTPLL
jgi:hypothetical protein